MLVNLGISPPLVEALFPTAHFNDVWVPRLGAEWRRAAERASSTSPRALGYAYERSPVPDQPGSPASPTTIATSSPLGAGCRAAPPHHDPAEALPLRRGAAAPRARAAHHRQGPPPLSRRPASRRAATSSTRSRRAGGALSDERDAHSVAALVCVAGCGFDRRAALRRRRVARRRAVAGPRARSPSATAPHAPRARPPSTPRASARARRRPRACAADGDCRSRERCVCGRCAVAVCDSADECGADGVCTFADRRCDRACDRRRRLRGRRALRARRDVCRGSLLDERRLPDAARAANRRRALCVTSPAPTTRLLGGRSCLLAAHAGARSPSRRRSSRTGGVSSVLRAHRRRRRRARSGTRRRRTASPFSSTPPHALVPAARRRVARSPTAAYLMVFADGAGAVRAHARVDERRPRVDAAPALPAAASRRWSRCPTARSPSTSRSPDGSAARASTDGALRRRGAGARARRARRSRAVARRRRARLAVRAAARRRRRPPLRPPLVRRARHRERPVDRSSASVPTPPNYSIGEAVVRRRRAPSSPTPSIRSSTRVLDFLDAPVGARPGGRRARRHAAALLPPRRRRRLGRREPRRRAQPARPSAS